MPPEDSSFHGLVVTSLMTAALDLCTVTGTDSSFHGQLAAPPMTAGFSCFPWCLCPVFINFGIRLSGLLAIDEVAALPEHLCPFRVVFLVAWVVGCGLHIIQPFCKFLLLSTTALAECWLPSIFLFKLQHFLQSRLQCRLCLSIAAACL